MKRLSFNLWAFIVLGMLFLANVMLGKARVLWGWDLPLLSDVWEFLLLLLVGLFFTLAALQRERQVGDRAAQRSRSLILPLANSPGPYRPGGPPFHQRDIEPRA